MLNFDKLKGYVNLLGRGAILEAAPEIAGGMLLELFQEWKVDRAMVTQYVQENISLWDKLDPQHLEMIEKVGRLVGNLDWLTADLAIQSIRKDYPIVASLFLGWPEAYEWLERQVAELKKLAQG